MIIKKVIQFNLRLIRENDIEDLRCWKNNYSQFFFDKKKITKANQKIWFDRYSKNPHNKMYILSLNEKNIGCMGIYDRKDHYELYNVITGDLSFRSTGLLSAALQELLKSLDKKIFVKVLDINPAIVWYEKNGFKLVKKQEDYSLFKWSKKK